MTALDLDAIEQRANAASRGPWEWRGDARFHTIELSNWLPGMGRCAILRPRRAGMQAATLEFAVEDWRMTRAEELAVYEVAPEATRADDPRVYRHDIIGIRHPDAEFIAHAREDVPALVAELRAWRALGAMLPEVIETASANASGAAGEFNVTREDHEATAREYAALDALTAALEALS